MADKSDLFIIKRNLFYYVKDELLIDRDGLKGYSFDSRVTDEILAMTSVNQRQLDFQNTNIIYNYAGNEVIIKRNGFVIDTADYSVNYGRLFDRSNGYEIPRRSRRNYSLERYNRSSKISASKTIGRTCLR